MYYVLACGTRRVGVAAVLAHDQRSQAPTPGVRAEIRRERVRNMLCHRLKAFRECMQ